jgi:hypothetical protein
MRKIVFLAMSCLIYSGVVLGGGGGSSVTRISQASS